ncbi:hypothetical protein [Brucella pituitosa]|uniref:hypothetical protein n=1 Tax=Brucella pituitosa TaxID=571256 RepID=UPI0009A22E3B|nr:hypothetical protein [Brucella pituitosa]
MLQFDGNWRYESPSSTELTVINAFRDLIDRISTQADRRTVLELFKSRFAGSAGWPYHPSSSVSWASDDLDKVMSAAGENTPLFIEAFYEGCNDVAGQWPDMTLPYVGRINRILADAGAGYHLEPPVLRATRAHIPIAVPEQPPSLDMQASALITAALEASERALAQGNGRQAVQEVLWLLETIATAFRGLDVSDSSIQGRYFNKIIGELRSRGRGHQEQILHWMMTLHGYLSSPTGGGVRHGTDLVDGLALGIDEARLYCNLIRSYLTFLIAEHERVSQRAAS